VGTEGAEPSRYRAITWSRLMTGEVYQSEPLRRSGGRV